MNLKVIDRIAHWVIREAIENQEDGKYEVYSDEIARKFTSMETSVIAEASRIVNAIKQYENVDDVWFEPQEDGSGIFTITPHVDDEDIDFEALMMMTADLAQREYEKENSDD